jgi:S1-C subfamily serine protease
MPQRRLSRETRNLLTAALVALVVLWALARVRFPDRPVTPNPIPPLLNQLSVRPGLAELASEVARLRIRLSGTLLALPSNAAASPSLAGVDAPDPPALRIRSDLAITLAARPLREPQLGNPDVLAADRATGLVVMRTDPDPAAYLPAPWAPEPLDVPRFLLATVVSSDRVALAPVFVSGLSSIRSAAWSTPVWRAPSDLDLPSGTILFTPAGELAGAVLHVHAGPIIVPGETLLSDAPRLLERGLTVPGNLGIRAQELTPRLSEALRASMGAIVSGVDPEGPAAQALVPGDVIEALNGIPLETFEEWDVRSNRLSADERVVLHVRRRGISQQIALVAAGARSTTATRTLGLTLRAVTGVGAEVTRVEPGSAAQEAGILPGDIITLIDGAGQPTPARIRAAYADADRTRSLILALRRGDGDLVVALP